MIRLEQTRGMAENAIAALKAARSRLPPASYARVQQLVRRRLLGPDGDRRQGTQSSRVEGKMSSVRQLHDDIVTVFVHGDNIVYNHRGIEVASPLEHLGQHGERAERALDR